MIDRLVYLYRTSFCFKQFVDQTGHVLGAMLLLLPSVWGEYWLSAGLIGFIREVEQIFSDSDTWSWHWRRTLDVTFWVVGGGLLQWVT
jgi:hypothetical protein